MGTTFNTLFMVRVRVRFKVISGCDVTLNMSIAVRIKLQSEKLMKISTLQFEVAVRVRLKLETLTLILQSQSAQKDGGFMCRIRVRVLGPTFDTLFMVMVRVRVIFGYDVTLDMSTAVRIKLHTLKLKFSPTNLQLPGKNLCKSNCFKGHLEG